MAELLLPSTRHNTPNENDPPEGDLIDLFNMDLSASTGDMSVKIQPLETSQDWPNWFKGVRTKLEWHNLYKYIQTDVNYPTGTNT